MIPLAIKVTLVVVVLAIFLPFLGDALWFRYGRAWWLKRKARKAFQRGAQGGTSSGIGGHRKDQG